MQIEWVNNLIAKAKQIMDIFFASALHWQRCNLRTLNGMIARKREKEQEREYGVAAEWVPLYASQWLSWLECSSTLTKCQQNSFLSPLHMSMPSHSFPLAIIQLAVVASPLCTFNSSESSIHSARTQAQYRMFCRWFRFWIFSLVVFFSLLISFFVESNSTQLPNECLFTHAHTYIRNMVVQVFVWTQSSEFIFCRRCPFVRRSLCSRP